MTPPDSGERCNEALGEDRVVYQCSRPKGHVGQHRDGNVAAWDQEPDSGEREVCGANWNPNLGPHYPCALPVGHGGRHEYLAAEAMAVLPLPLAHRILGALEDIDTQEVRAIRAELRARVPR